MFVGTDSSIELGTIADHDNAGVFWHWHRRLTFLFAENQFNVLTT
jgi:hypothetical protein